MGIEIIFIVVVSAVMHPFWNLLVKKNADPQLGYMFLTMTVSLCGLAHGLSIGANFSAAFTVLPLIGLSVFGQFLYGTCLTATLKRGDLSVYYPIIRSSPVFIVIVSMLVFGKSYPFEVLIGVALVVTGGVFLLFRRGGSLFEDKWAVGFSVIAMCGTGIYSMSDARIMQAVEPAVLVFIVDGILASIYAVLLFGRNRKAQRAMAPLAISRESFLYLILPGMLAYGSYFLILTAYQLGGDVAAVTSLRQVSIPISVALGGLFLREGAMRRRFFAAGMLAIGIVVVAING